MHHQGGPCIIYNKVLTLQAAGTNTDHCTECCSNASTQDNETLRPLITVTDTADSTQMYSAALSFDRTLDTQQCP